MNILKNVFLALIFVLLISALGFYTSWFGIFIQSKLGVYSEDVRRNNFEHTKSYNQGKIEDLAKYFHEYNQSTDDAGKASIKSVVRQQFSDYDSSLVQDDQLRQFLQQCRL